MFVVLMAILLLHLKFINSKVFRALKDIPTKDRHFLFGHVLKFYTVREDWFISSQNFTRQFAPITVIWIGHQPRVSLMRARVAEKLLNSTRDLDKANEYRFLIPWLGYGLLTSTGAKWHQRRKLITPTFHFRILEDFLRIINEQAELLVSILEKQENEAFDIYPYLSRCTLDVICETAMGKSINVQMNTGSEYFKAINSMGEIFVKRSMRPWLRPEWLFHITSLGKQLRKDLDILHGFTKEVIKERRKANNEELKSNPPLSTVGLHDEVQGQKRRLAFLDMLLNSQIEGKSLTDEDIREEVDTFMFEGHDTTSSALTWILFNLGRFPEIQKKVHEELDQIFGDSNRVATMNDLAELKYLERVIKESMRIFPPVPFFGRKLSDDLEICGYVIPAGVSVSISVFNLHRDPEFFPDPERFDPDRFLPENCIKRHPFAYIPFSAGPRNCIGQKFALMEEKVIVSQILRRFQVTSVHQLEDIKILGELILRPAKGMWLKLQTRN